MAKILIVEDDVHSAEMVVSWLESERHNIDHAKSGEEAIEHLKMMEYDVILLDWDLPGMSGYDVLKQFRAMGHTTPVIMLTGKSKVEDKEEGLDGGADDYLTKPYSLKELSARIRAQMRRTSNVSSNQLEFRNIVLIPDQMRVTREGKDINLLPKEFTLLEFFMRNPDRVFTADSIMIRVWGSEAETSTDAFRSTLKRLRQKIDAPEAESPVIETVHGAGYRFNSK
ncbi:MAG TPA: response regulator transcription factor [Drouetiella sp.]